MEQLVRRREDAEGGSLEEDGGRRGAELVVGGAGAGLLEDPPVEVEPTPALVAEARGVLDPGAASCALLLGSMARSIKGLL